MFNKELPASIKSNIKSAEFGWSAPSNIALVKYWGKKDGIQIPSNPSVSLTLENARTNAEMIVSPKGEQWIELFFEGEVMPAFLPKIEKFFNLTSQYLPFVKDFSFTLKTSNTFPHSAGIASSASSMAAIALCLVEFEESVTGESYQKSNFFERASFLARLGSGSACRSLFSHGASWGQGESFGNDLLASPIKMNDKFKTMRDTIILVDTGEKKVSSRQGHGLMRNHPYAESRFIHAHENWQHAISWLEDGNWDYLGNLVEEEALALHAMMMTSRPGYILMDSKSVEVINKVRKFRYSTEVPLYFTLDAGPNIHLLYPEEVEGQCLEFIKNEILSISSGLSMIEDHVGLGPSPIRRKS